MGEVLMFNLDQIQHIRPEGRYVLLERLDTETATPDGRFELSNERFDKNYHCKIIAVGPGVHAYSGMHVPATVRAKVGDIVIVRQFEGQKISKLSDKYLLCDGRYIEAIKNNYLQPALATV